LVLPPYFYDIDGSDRGMGYQEKGQESVVFTMGNNPLWVDCSSISEEAHIGLGSIDRKGE